MGTVNRNAYTSGRRSHYGRSCRPDVLTLSFIHDCMDPTDPDSIDIDIGNQSGKSEPVHRARHFTDGFFTALTRFLRS